MYRAAYSILKNPHDADDVAQEALVRALRKMRLFSGTGNLEGWLARIAFNLAKNHLRARSRRRESALLDGDDFEEAFEPPEDRLHREAQQQKLQAAIETLPQKQRAAVELRLVGHLSFREVAQVMGVKEATAKVHYSQAKQKLVSLLQREVLP